MEDDEAAHQQPNSIDKTDVSMTAEADDSAVSRHEANGLI
jgi:hypothetical protein